MASMKRSVVARIMPQGGLRHPSRAAVRRGILALWLALALSSVADLTALAQVPPRVEALQTIPRDRLRSVIGGFFDEVSRGAGAALEKALSEFGEPVAYIVGEELSGSVVVGGRHGVGRLYLAATGPIDVTWAALSIGFGLGAEYGRVVMLVYGASDAASIYGNYASVGGSAHLLVGANVTILASDRAKIVFISSGLGLRFSADVSGLRISPRTQDAPPRPPGRVCANPADCSVPR